jgi:flavin reductase (DIM6/NTAB) family NADH-FMN oxidoreductase RutF
VSPGAGQVVGPVPEGRQPDVYDRLRRRVLWALPTGLYLLGSGAGGRRNLMTISWVTQVAVEPKMVAIGVESSAVTHALVAESGTFALSLLPRSQRAVVRKFAKPVAEADVDIDEERREGTMNGEPVRLAPGGDPVLGQCAAWLQCTVRHRLGLGSHSLFVGEVTNCGIGAPTRAGEKAGGQAEAGSPVEAGAEEQAAGPGEVLRMEDTRMNYGG